MSRNELSRLKGNPYNIKITNVIDLLSRTLCKQQ